MSINQREKTKTSDGKKDTPSKFFQQVKPKEVNVNAKASPESTMEHKDSITTTILADLKTFRRENNEKLGSDNIGYKLPGTVC